MTLTRSRTISNREASLSPPSTPSSNGAVSATPKCSQQQQQPMTRCSNVRSFEELDELFCPASGSFETGVGTSKRNLYCTVTISEIAFIDPITNSCNITLRIYGIVEVDLQALGLSALAKRVQASGCVRLSQKEVLDVNSKTVLPVLSLADPRSYTEYDPTCVRIYGDGSRQYIMYNRGLDIVCPQEFNLRNFPFDYQTLRFPLIMTNSIDWPLFNLVVYKVELEHGVIDRSLEWAFHVPTVVALTAGFTSTISIQATRMPYYYTLNVAAIIFMLLTLGLLAFAMDLRDVSSRVQTILTLLLTCVAFKFIIADVLPKIPYNTALDSLIFTATLHLAALAFMTTLPSFFALDENAKLVNDALLFSNILALISSLMHWFFKGRKAMSLAAAGSSPAIIMSPGDLNYSFEYNRPHFIARPGCSDLDYEARERKNS